MRKAEPALQKDLGWNHGLGSVCVGSLLVLFSLQSKSMHVRLFGLSRLHLGVSVYIHGYLS